MNFSFRLAKKGKQPCPSCGKKTFVLYLNIESKQPLDSGVGKCDRADNCGFHYPPREFFRDNSHLKTDKPTFVKSHQIAKKPTIPTSYISHEILQKTLCRYDQNHLAAYLRHLLGLGKEKELVLSYLVGTAKHWQGATVFWQIDIAGNIRTGKVMLYNPETGKRVKKSTNRIDWVHNLLKLPNFNLKQCFFGEHLLARNPEKVVAIVESEKTALIASAYVPDMLWLACGGSQGLSSEKFEVLRNRKVILFPDEGQYEKWLEKSKHLNHVGKLFVSPLLEKLQGFEKGIDIADLL